MIANLEEDNVPLPEFQNKTNCSIDDIVINFEEIIDVIQILNPNKASGPDLISHKMLKICPEKIATPFK